MKFILPEL